MNKKTKSVIEHLHRAGVETLARSVLKVGGAFMVHQGWVAQSRVTMISAGIITGIGVLWGVLHESRAHRKPKPGDVCPRCHRVYHAVEYSKVGPARRR